MRTSTDIKVTDSNDDLIRQGWTFHARGEEEAAEKSFREAVSADPKNVEALYGLAMVLKSQGRRKDTIEVFNQVLELLENQEGIQSVRSTLLRRLVKAHINQIQTGNWNLESEIWQRKN